MRNFDISFNENTPVDVLASKDILLVTKLYDRIRAAMSNERNVEKFVSAVYKYRDKNIDIFSSPYILEMNIFTPQDFKLVWDLLDIEEKEVKKLVKDVKLPGKLTKPKANFTPFNIILCLLMRYFKYDYYDKSKRDEYYKVTYMYYIYSTYWSIFKKYYKYPPREATMKYVINNKLNNKFLIKQTKNLEEALLITIRTALDTYEHLLKRSNDYDLMMLIDAIKTRLSNFMKNIWKVYKESNEDGDVMFSITDMDTEGNLLDTGGIVNKVEVLANSATTKFFSNGVDMKIITLAAKMSNCSVNELRTAVNLLTEEGRIDEVKEFYSALFYLYFNEHPEKDKPEGLRFLYEMDAIYKKGNSSDKNIKAIKTLMNEWLERGSASYRASTNKGTLNNFRRAIFWFFVQNC